MKLATLIKREAGLTHLWKAAYAGQTIIKHERYCEAQLEVQRLQKPNTDAQVGHTVDGHQSSV